MLRRLALWLKELRDGVAFFSPDNQPHRQLVFYSERDIYYKYFDGLIDYLLNNCHLTFSYITSDPDDPIFRHPDSRIKRFYVRHTLAALFDRLDSRIVVMTMPDLNQSFLRRPQNNGVEFVYKFHVMVSSHLHFKKGAFDNYDTIFCVGPHQINEIRKTEEVYGLPPKQLIGSGYHYVEKLYKEHANLQPSANHRPLILIAPTWGPSCIFESCIEELLVALSRTPYLVRLRPHPEFIKRKPEKLSRVMTIIKQHDNLEVEHSMTSNQSILQADVLITDRSGIAFEYACATERPVLFIDTPLKMENPEYEKLNLEPVELRLRKQIGLCVSLDEIEGIAEKLEQLIEGAAAYRERIISCRAELLFNWLNSSAVEGRYLIERLQASQPCL